MRPLPLAVLVLCSALVAPTVTYSSAEASAIFSSVAVAPGFNLPTDSGTVSLQSLEGKVVLVDFWASWCGPCEKSFPWLATMHERYGAAGLEIVAISLDKDHAAAETFLERHPAPFTVAFDPSAGVAKAFHVSGLPSTVLIGPKGEILYSHVGFDPKKTTDLEARICKACGS